MTFGLWNRRTLLSASLLLAVPVIAGAKLPKDTDAAYVKVVTSLGDITLELNRAKAPVSADNFLKYVDKKFYDGTVFHRVIPDFMIQGGGFTPDMTQKSGMAPIKNEWQNGLKNVRGSIAMARTSDPDSATSQFFINVKDNGFLDQPRGGAAYAVFGKVVEGIATVDKIKAVATTTKGPYENVPETAVVIKSARRLSDEDVKALKARLAKGDKK